MNDQALMSSRLGTLSALINQVLEPAFRRPCAADTPYTRKTRKHPACHCASIHRRDKGFRRDVACGHANDVRQKAAPRDANRRTRMLARAGRNAGHRSGHPCDSRARGTGGVCRAPTAGHAPRLPVTSGTVANAGSTLMAAGRCPPFDRRGERIGCRHCLSGA